MTGISSIDPGLTILIARLMAGYLTVNEKSNVYSGDGDPNGFQIGESSDLYIRKMPPFGLYQKTGGTDGDKTGWVLIAGSSPSSDDFGTYGLRLVGTTGQGAVDTSVFLFSTAPALGMFAVPTATWLQQTNSAGSGSVFTIIRPGTYSALLNVPSNSGAPGDSPFIGVTVDAQDNPALLTAPPIFGVFPQVVCGTSEQDASLPSSLFASAPFYVPQDLIDSGGGQVRFQCTPGAPVVNALVGMTILRLGPCVIP